MESQFETIIRLLQIKDAELRHGERALIWADDEWVIMEKYYRLTRPIYRTEDLADALNVLENGLG